MSNQTQPNKRDILVVEDRSPMAFLMDAAKFEHLQRVSRLMALATLTPKHLKGATLDETLANCFRVVNQAMRWGFDPFAVVDETYVVHGRLGYQGKLVAAVINARAGLKKRLSPTYTGEGTGRTVTISGHFDGEDEPRTVTLSVAQAKTDNQLWQKDPDQKLFYSGVIKWARRHCPELILGVMTDEDLDRMAMERPIHAEGPSSTDTVAGKLRALASGGEPGQADGPKEIATQPPRCSEQILEAIENELARLGVSAAGIDKLLHDFKVPVFKKLTQEQAETLLGRLQDEPEPSLERQPATAGDDF